MASRAHVPSGAFASAQPGRIRVQSVAPSFAPARGYDFQLQGRGLGE